MIQNSRNKHGRIVEHCSKDSLSTAIQRTIHETDRVSNISSFNKLKIDSSLEKEKLIKMLIPGLHMLLFFQSENRTAIFKHQGSFF